MNPNHVFLFGWICWVFGVLTACLVYSTYKLGLAVGEEWRKKRNEKQLDVIVGNLVGEGNGDTVRDSLDNLPAE